jgi:hypothetical protein
MAWNSQLNLPVGKASRRRDEEHSIELERLHRTKPTNMAIFGFCWTELRRTKESVDQIKASVPRRQADSPKNSKRTKSLILILTSPLPSVLRVSQILYRGVRRNPQDLLLLPVAPAALLDQWETAIAFFQLEPQSQHDDCDCRRGG